jgi:hypothetical protein
MRPQHADGALWNEGLCGRCDEGPQLMRKSLGRSPKFLACEAVVLP